MKKKTSRNFNWIMRLTKENYFWNSYHDRGKSNRRKALNPFAYFETDLMSDVVRVKFVDECEN